MAFTVDGSLIQATASTFTLVPGHTGELIMMAVTQVSNNTVTATALSSSNATWTLVRTYKATGSHQTGTVAIFTGVALNTSSQTVTVSWSGTAPATIRIVGRAFTTTTGAWTVPSGVDLDGAGTATWPSLTPPIAGCLYWGYAIDSGTATAGTTPGFTYEVDSHSNGEAFNPNCLQSLGALAPVWSDAGSELGSMVMVQESSLLMFATADAATTDAHGNTVNYGATLAEGCGPAIPGEGWHTVSLASGVTGNMAGSVGCRVKKLPWNAVWLDIEVTVTNAAGATITIGSLPDLSYYPQVSRHFPLAQAGTPSALGNVNQRVFIGTSGGLQIITHTDAGGSAAGLSVIYPVD